MNESFRVRWGLGIHGGVGVLSPEEMTPELEKGYRETLAASLAAGYRAMKEGGTAMDGVVEAIRVMEDSVLFNAGRGSNLTSEEAVSMDASLMVGNTLEAGAVSGVSTVRHPILLARAVLEKCPHVMLSGPGADSFAREQGLVVEDPAWFVTERRRDDLRKARAREAQGSDRPNTVDGSDPPADVPPRAPTRDTTGTVGAVALDAAGLLVAGTSTGGMANKKWGRVGDSPIIGAGTYAGSHCAVSCTGWGEYFIRNAVAHDIQARMAYLGVSLEEAVRQVVLEKLEAQRKGLGGVVAMDRAGNGRMGFNTLGMYRGWVGEEGRVRVAVYEEAAG